MKKLILLSLSLLASAIRAEDATPDHQARFLAGLPIDGTPLESIAKESGWSNHARAFENAWGELEKKQLSKIRDWTPKVLAKDSTSTDPMIAPIMVAVMMMA